ncbi:hypothetical protein LTR10_015050 [Elasticomyces elasticus]|nr:hypothetical protein LTR10_015050 [Elasticomyces elasticus]
MDLETSPEQSPRPWRKLVRRAHTRLSTLHSQTPYLRRLPLAAILIITLLIIINLVVWAICGLILTAHTRLLSTAALAYTLGLRHALDADHISAIDLMTRRLIATGQRPVTVGTFFSLGHSTIVVVTSIVVAATAAGVSKRFNGFSNIGGIIGSSVSAAFLILLGLMNAYILYRLVLQIRKVIRLRPHEEAAEAWKIEGAGCLFRVLKSAFRLIDRPWKMYPLGVLFGLGFDTSSEIALLGISSIQGAKGTSMWLILVFPVLFTAGMCLVDTIDGALMMSLYVAPMGMTSGDDKKPQPQSRDQRDESVAADVDVPTDTDRITPSMDGVVDMDVEQRAPSQQDAEQPAPRVKDPLTFLYYSIVLTTLTVICAIIIGIIQLLTMILNVATPKGKFWDGVEVAGDNYEIIGGSICASFVVFGGISVLCYKPWGRWVDRERQRLWADMADDAGVASGNTMPGSSYRDDMPQGTEGLALSQHGDAEELVEVGQGGKTARVSVKAYEETGNVGVPGASGGR